MFRLSEEWYIAIARYVSYPIIFSLLIIACRTKNTIFQARIICAIWICTLVPFLILASNPFLYEFIGDIFLRENRKIISFNTDKLRKVGSTYYIYIPSLINTLTRLTAFGMGMYYGAFSFGSTLNRLGEDKAYRAISLSIGFAKYAFNFTSKYILFQAFALFDFLIPFYFVLWSLLSLFSAKNLSSKRWIICYVLKIMLVVLILIRLNMLFPLDEMFSLIIDAFPDFIKKMSIVILLNFLPIWFSIYKLTELVMLIVYMKIFEKHNLVVELQLTEFNDPIANV